ncbi:squalene/phytoene synthase family protein [Ectothiorhodospiraceae bacterium WFHF3C12]|nr:squalene/phytoene synthase family protein [Ectothiorhodospiraceae bacterium WFHF3C12]
MSSQDYCQDKGAPTGSSLYYALLFAPPERRHALTALSAWRREVGSVVPDCSDAGVAAVKLNWWHEEVDRLFQGQPRHPVTQALLDPVRSLELPREQFDQVLEGARMDLEYGSYPSFRELSVYCHNMGSAAAHLAVTTAGYTDPQTPRFAHDLGMALQLGSLLRNLPRDLAAGRLYVPEDELRQAGLDRDELLNDNAEPEALTALLREQADRVQGFIAHARDRLPAADRSSQRTGLILLALQERLLLSMAADGYPLMRRRHHLTPLHKLWVAWRTARRARRGRAA